MRLLRIKNRWLVGFTALIACGGLAVWRFWPEQNVPQPTPPTPQMEDQGGPPLHPLMIEAMRAKEYPGSDIVIEQELGDQGGFSSRIVSYRSDGFKIYALMTVPPGVAPAGGWPIVVLNHGYIPPTQYQTNGSDYRTWIGLLSRNGYVVIKPDYRGHGRSEGSPASGHFAPDYAYDALNLVSSLKRHPTVNPAKIGMLGHSLGGHVALRTIVVSQDVRATVMAGGVVGSVEDIIYNWHRRSGPAIPNHIRTARQQLFDQYGEPKDNPEFWGKISAINYVAGVTGAVQIHHGTDDESVPPLFSEHLHQALQAAGKPNELHIYPGGDHNFSRDQGVYLQRTLDFLNRHLK